MNDATNTDPQLTLKLFEDLMPSGASIAESPTDVGFNIAQILVDVKDLTLLAKRALMGCYYIAATSAQSDANTPVVPGVRPVFRADLGLFKWLINYGKSNNVDHLKDALTRAQKALIQMNVIDPSNPAKDLWGSVHLMGEVAIGNGQIVFDLPASLAHELSNPTSRNGVVMYLSLRIQANFTSIHAQTLHAKIAAMKDAGCTPWMTLAEFASWMHVEPTEFKYLNRDVIKIAVAQINEHSDVTLTLETQKLPKSRSVGMVRFLIVRKTNFAPVNEMERETEIYKILTEEFGMGVTDLNKFQQARNDNAWSIDRVMNAIEYTRSKIHGGKETIRRPGGYFQRAVAEGWSLGTAPALAYQAAQKTTAMNAQLREKVRQVSEEAQSGASAELSALVANSKTRFESLTEDEQHSLWAKFRAMRTVKTLIGGIEKKTNQGAEMARETLILDPKISGLWWGFVAKQLEG